MSRHGGGPTRGRPPRAPIAAPTRPRPAPADATIPRCRRSSRRPASRQLLYPPSPDRPVKPVKMPRTGKVPTDPAESREHGINQGNIGLMLANNRSPCTVNSFVNLAQQVSSRHHLSPADHLLALLGFCNAATLRTACERSGYQLPANTHRPVLGERPQVEQAVIYPRDTGHGQRRPNTTAASSSGLPGLKAATQYTVFGTIQTRRTRPLDKDRPRPGVAGGGGAASPPPKSPSSVLLD